MGKLKAELAALNVLMESEPTQQIPKISETVESELQHISDRIRKLRDRDPEAQAESNPLGTSERSPSHVCVRAGAAAPHPASAIQPSSRALSLASLQACDRNSSDVSTALGS
jgi:hypothetical protein